MVSSAPQAQVVIGLDPGYDRLGWAVGVRAGKITLLGYGCISTTKKAALSQRYAELLEQFDAVLDEFKPSVASIETLFFSNNQTTAMKVAEARGVILAALARRQIAIHEYAPNQVKLAVTGHGRADKAAVQKMIQLQVILPPTAAKDKILDDTYDAMGLLLTYLTDAQARSSSV